MKTPTNLVTFIVLILSLQFVSCNEKKKDEQNNRGGAEDANPTATPTQEPEETATIEPTLGQSCYETLNTIISSGILTVFTQGKSLDVVLDTMIKDDIKKFLEKELGKPFSSLESGAFEVGFALFKDAMKKNDCKSLLSGDSSFTEILKSAFGLPTGATPTPTPTP